MTTTDPALTCSYCGETGRHLICMTLPGQPGLWACHQCLLRTVDELEERSYCLACKAASNLILRMITMDLEARTLGKVTAQKVDGTGYRHHPTCPLADP
jgi:hypothetical protein